MEKLRFSVKADLSKIDMHLNRKSDYKGKKE